MAHHEIQLPEDIERGALGGPKFKTTIFPLTSGWEFRNEDWEVTKGEWDVSYGLLNMELDLYPTYVHLIRDFFYARRGRVHSFNFKDWADFEIGDYTDPTSENQQIGTGDAALTQFQIYKLYQDSAGSFQRPLQKIVTGRFAVLLDGVLQTEGVNYTIDLTLGIITFTSAPGAGVAVQVACEYFNPVRFDIDHLQIQVETSDAGSIPQIPIKGVRL